MPATDRANALEAAMRAALTAIDQCPGYDMRGETLDDVEHILRTALNADPRTLTQRLRDLGVPNAVLTAKFSGWSLADDIFAELVAAGTDPTPLVDIARRSRTGRDAARLFNDPAQPWNRGRKL